MKKYTISVYDWFDRTECWYPEYCSSFYLVVWFRMLKLKYFSYGFRALHNTAFKVVDVSKTFDFIGLRDSSVMVKAFDLTV